MNGLIEQIPALLIALLTGGGGVALLVHLREKPRADAETATIRWELIRDELSRQSERNRLLEEEVSAMRRRERDCERRCADLEAKLMKLEAMIQGHGEGMQRAQEALSAERLAARIDRGE